MSVKVEYQCDFNFNNNVNDGCESGECSQEEIEHEMHHALSKKAKHKKHKKKKRKNKKASRSSSEDYEVIFSSFDPYKTGDIEDENIESNVAMVKMEECENYENGENDNEMLVDNENVKPLNNCNYNNNSNSTNDAVCNLSNGVVVNKITPHKETIIARKIIDPTGIDTCTDCSRILSKMGFSIQVINDYLKVLNQIDSESENEEEEENALDDDYDVSLIQQLPIIEPNNELHDTNRYSPEPTRSDVIVEPYKSKNNVKYANVGRVVDVIDITSIPIVTSQDPRVNSNSAKSLSKNNFMSKLPIPIIDESKLNSSLPVSGESNLLLDQKDWESTVANMVKVYLKPYLHHNDITKDEYKSIMKRAVLKIVNSGDRKLESAKISTFVHSYVVMTQKTRVLS